MHIGAADNNVRGFTNRVDIDVLIELSDVIEPGCGYIIDYGVNTIDS